MQADQFPKALPAERVSKLQETRDRVAAIPEEQKAAAQARYQEFLNRTVVRPPGQSQDESA